jgi:hypothetical protein
MGHTGQRVLECRASGSHVPTAHSCCSAGVAATRCRWRRTAAAASTTSAARTRCPGTCAQSPQSPTRLAASRASAAAPARPAPRCRRWLQAWSPAPALQQSLLPASPRRRRSSPSCSRRCGLWPTSSRGTLGTQQRRLRQPAAAAPGQRSPSSSRHKRRTARRQLPSTA